MKRFLKQFRYDKGFTLIELLIAIPILGILAADYFPMVRVTFALLKWRYVG